MAKDFGAPFVDVIGQVMPLSVDGMIPVIRRWIDMSDEIGMPIQFETHRNCITNDLYATLCLIDAVPEMRLCADLSHFVVDREFKLPLDHRDQGLIQRIIDRSDSFQGRVASRQQIQLQLDFPQHAKWVELFRGWWRDGLESWRARNDEGDCIFLCELGPPEYAMTGPDGREMSSRWDEALTIRRWVMEMWDEMERGSCARLLTDRLAVPPRGNRLGKNAHDLEHDRHAQPGGAAGRIERRRDLDKIRADEIDAGQLAHHLLGLK